MPEGPEIRRAADNLEAAVKGKPLTDVWFAFEQLKPYQSQLIGQRVTQLETRGKALLTYFSNGLTLYSHNQLYGVWRVVDTGKIPQTSRVLRVRLQTHDKTILLYSASDIEILTPEQLSTHPDLMGPEVLDVLRELSEVATLAVVTNGFQKVQIRRLAESGVLNFMEDVFVSEKMDSEKPNRRIFDAALRALGVENREHVLVVGDGLSSDIQGGVNAGLDTCWYNPSHAENPGKVVPTYEIADLKELYPLVMEQEELANVGLKNRRHQC